MTRQEAYDKLQELANDFGSLRFTVNSNDTLADCIDSARFGQGLLALRNDIVTESLFSELCDEVEDDKSLFTVQKKSKSFFDDVLIHYIDDVVAISKLWSFHDYRAVNLQSEARDLAKEIRDFYVEIYR